MWRRITVSLYTSGIRISKDIDNGENYKLVNSKTVYS